MGRRQEPQAALQWLRRDMSISSHAAPAPHVWVTTLLGHSPSLWRPRLQLWESMLTPVIQSGHKCREGPQVAYRNAFLRKAVNSKSRQVTPSPNQHQPPQQAGSVSEGSQRTRVPILGQDGGRTRRQWARPGQQDGAGECAGDVRGQEPNGRGKEGGWAKSGLRSHKFRALSWREWAGLT